LFQEDVVWLKKRPANILVLNGQSLSDCKSYAVMYIDDVLVYPPDWDFHLQDLQKVLSTLAEAGLIVKLVKCQWERRYLDFLATESVV